MILQIDFKEIESEIKTEFGEVHNISDGGYERGYTEGAAVGYTNGYTEGKTEGIEQGYNDGYAKAESVNPLYWLQSFEMLWQRATFPENFDLVLHVKEPKSLNSTFNGAKNLKTITLISDTPDTAISTYNFFRECPQLEMIDLTKFNRKFTDLRYFLIGSTKLVTIKGALDLSECTNTTYAFAVDRGVLQNIEFVPNTIKKSILFNFCNHLTDKSIQSIIDGLADLTGQTAQTVTFHSTVGAKLTDEQKAIITAKNWALVY